MALRLAITSHAWRQQAAGLPFLLPYVVPLTMLWGVATEQLILFRIVAWTWGVVVVLDVLVPHDRLYAGSDAPHPMFRSALWDVGVLGWVPLQLAVVSAGVYVTTWTHVSTPELVLITVAIGFSGGMLCMPVAHELMHRRGWLHRVAADVLLLSVSYPHFRIEHVHGHHRRVATRSDPATARLGESFYAFYPRTLIDGITSAWHIESARLCRRGRRPWGIANRLVRSLIVLVIVYALIYMCAGGMGVAFFAAQSVLGFSTLEVINYVQHYGLLRHVNDAGATEPVRPSHSWNSAHRVSNWMSFNLGHHSDHHCDARTEYPHLRRRAAEPQLPAGSFAMFLLPFCPPLWRKVMDPRVHAWQQLARKEQS